MEHQAHNQSTSLSFPNVSVITLYNAHIGIMTHEGEIITHQLGDRFTPPPILNQSPIMTCHAPWIASKIQLKTRPAFDVLELFAFVHAGQFITPTLRGLAQFCTIDMPQDIDDAPFTLIEIAQSLLSDLQSIPDKDKPSLISIAKSMARGGFGWAWAPYVIEALGGTFDPRHPTNPKQDMNIFDQMPEWSEDAPPPPNSFTPIHGDEARETLSTFLSRRSHTGKDSQNRPQQQLYTTRIADCFHAKSSDDSPNILVAQAGTGIGKTYGYLAPSTLWAQKNQGCVTISTYTKNLQRQIEQDLEVIYPDKDERDRKAISQKGRENYLCLLNLDDLIARCATAQNDMTVIAAGIMARWAMTTNDGDLSGNSFPGWLTNLLGVQNTVGLSDRRGECIYAACDHYHKCFIERMNRKAKRAEILINNHALTMIRAATDRVENAPPFIIFDEAHHLFHAADSAFGANLNGVETSDLRRWLIGPEDDKKRQGGQSRGRGLRKRLDGLIDESSPAYHDIGKIIVAAKETLPTTGWRQRVFNGDPFGDVEKLIAALYHHTQTRTSHMPDYYSVECDITPIPDTVIDVAKNARASLQKIRKPLQDLAENLKAMLEDKADDLDKDTMNRLGNLSSSIEHRSTMVLGAWIMMLDRLIDNKPDNALVAWFEITKMDGKLYDCGYYNRYKNPMEPLGNALRHTSHGIVLTSATLNVGEDMNPYHDAQLGLPYLSEQSAERLNLPSPYNYQAQSKIFIITDIDKTNMMAVANAYKAIFQATNGGALGIFTAINRLQKIYHATKDVLERQSIPVYAQHNNDTDIGTLIDMFRDEENACLLGTDAIRDGIDVAGQSLRCIVFDRVPWPRPTILHRERKNIFGGRAYDEDLTRQKLKQAYGRLIRNENDKGVFIMLDGATPSRLLDAFPIGVDIHRLPLKDALKDIKDFLK